MITDTLGAKPCLQCVAAFSAKASTCCRTASRNSYAWRVATPVVRHLTHEPRQWVAGPAVRGARHPGQCWRPARLQPRGRPRRHRRALPGGRPAVTSARLSLRRSRRLLEGVLRAGVNDVEADSRCAATGRSRRAASRTVHRRCRAVHWEAARQIGAATPGHNGRWCVHPAAFTCYSSRAQVPVRTDARCRHGAGGRACGWTSRVHPVGPRAGVT